LRQVITQLQKIAAVRVDQNAGNGIADP